MGHWHNLRSMLNKGDGIICTGQAGLPICTNPPKPTIRVRRLSSKTRLDGLDAEIWLL